jgi:hypothetical protein
MQKLTITIALAVIALALGTTTITKMQIQPAYSQATHCTTDTRPGEEVRSTCVTPGQNPSATVCVDDFCRDAPLTHQDAGQLIGRNHQGCAQGFGECTVGNPNE